MFKALFESIQSLFRTIHQGTSYVENTVAESNMDSYQSLKAKRDSFSLTKADITELKEFRNELL